MDSRDIFEMRKKYNSSNEKEMELLLVEAYNNALELLKEDEKNIWNIKAYIYVTNDICKKYVIEKKYKNIEECVNIINRLDIDKNDEILVKTVNKIKSYINKDNQILAEIKYYRDKKEYEKAYITSKKLNIKDNLNDDYIVSSYLYPITDMCILSYENNREDELEKYYKELCSIKIQLNNEYLAKRIEKIHKIADKTYKDQVEAKSYYDNKEYKKAMEIYNRLIKYKKNDVHINTLLGWCIYYIIKDNIINKINENISKKLLLQYLDLKVEKPSLLHSRILTLVLEISSIKLYKFIELWDIKYFRDEDYKQVEVNNKKYSSLVQKILSKLIKDSDAINNKANLEKYETIIDKMVENANGDIFAVRIRAFIKYYLNKIDEAEKDLIYFLKNKINEFWAWSDLGLIYLKKDDIKTTMSFYCKAMLLAPKSKLELSINVRKKLLDLLIQLNLSREAKYEAITLYNYYKESDKKIDNSIVNMMASDWFKNTESTQDNNDFYMKNSKTAETIFYKHTDKVKGILGDKFENKSNKICYNIYYKDNDNKINSYTIKNNMVNIQCKEEGTPIYVYMDYNKLTNKDEIYGIEERESGDKFDIIDRQIGVVNYVDTNTSRVNIVVSKAITENLYVDNKNLQLSVGDTVYVRLLYNNKKYKVVTCDKIEEEVETNLKQTFFDVIEHISLAGDAYISHVEKIDIELLKKYHYVPVLYIHKDLVKRFNLEEGDEVRCVGVLNYNKKKAQWGWSALSVEKVEFKNLDIDELENDDIED